MTSPQPPATSDVVQVTGTIHLRDGHTQPFSVALPVATHEQWCAALAGAMKAAEALSDSDDQGGGIAP